MNTIYKYEINLEEIIKLTIPFGSEILKFGMQNNKMFIWVLIDPERTKMEIREFHLFGTGHDIEGVNKLKYLGTAGDIFVWHLFEKIR